MKKIIALSALMAALVSANAFAIDSNVNFTGTVTSSTCTLNAADVTKTLTVPDISVAALTALGGLGFTSQSAATTVTFTSCPSIVSNVSVTKATTTGTIFNNTNSSYVPASGTATGINLVVYAGQASSGWLSADGSALNRTFAVTSGSVTIPVGVGVRTNVSLLSSSPAPTAGTYSSAYTLTFAWS